MPTISKIRFTHVVYEGGNKRYNDEIFLFHGHNGAVVLENGGGKTVFIQTAIQAVLPHADLAGRKMKDTLQLDNGPAHIAIEWILEDKPRRRYGLTCVTLFQTATGIDSYRFVYEYGEHDSNGLESLPFVRMHLGKPRSADKGEMQDYYASMEQRYPLYAKMFPTIKEYKGYLESQFQIISGEWDAIAKMNDSEGGIESFFDECKTTTQLFDRLLVPTVEQSIEGYEQGSFANMFESRREEFEKYKQLKEQIDENKKILQELGSYVQVAQQLDREERLYKESRSEAKAYFQLSFAQQQEVEEGSERLHQQEATWEQRSESLQRKRKSVDIVIETQNRDALESKLQLIEENKEQVEARLQEAQRYYYSLQYAQSREKKLAIEAKITQLEKQLARMSFSEDEQQLQERWELNGANLRYLFDADLLELDSRSQRNEGLLDSIIAELVLLTADLHKLQQDMVSRNLSMQGKETELRLKREQQEKIERAILANPQLEKVELQIPLWMHEEQQLEHLRLEQRKEMSKLEAERSFKEERRKAASEERAEAERVHARLQEQEERRLKEQEGLQSELVVLRSSWRGHFSLYEKQASIERHITEHIEKLGEHKSRLLMKERVAYRYVDDHGEQAVFFADASVARLCEQWGNQFSLLQLGTDYIAGLVTAGVDGGNTAAIAARQADHLWALTLLTTRQEKAALMRKLRETKSGYSFPIRVLSTEEAAAAVQVPQSEQQENAAGQWVVPGHWLSNADSQAFGRWKGELAEHAGLIKKEREQIEEELAALRELQRKLEQYFSRYPLELQQQAEQQRLSQQERLLERKRELERLDYELEANREVMDSWRRAEQETDAKIYQLGLWLQEGRSYQLLANEVAQLERERLTVLEQVELLGKQLTRCEAELLLKQEKQERLKQAKQEHRLQKQLLQQNERYAEVQAYTPKPCEGTLGALKEERKALELERHRIFQQRTGLEESLLRERESCADCLQLMEQLYKEHPDLVRNLPLPLETEERKNAQWKEIKEVQQQLERVAGEHNRTHGDWLKQGGSVELLLRQFTERYQGQKPDLFREPLAEVEKSLLAEAASLADEQEQLLRQRKQVNHQRNELEEVLALWNKQVLVHGLEDVRLISAVIGEQPRSDFRYQRKAFTERCIGQLGTAMERLSSERRIVQSRRQQLKDYYSNQVKDVKLRQMTLQGIEMKESYAELAEFHQSMQQRIQMATHLHEQTLQTQDRELQQFIQHIHSHLNLIVQELREIPKKTRVRTEEGWREIYSFSIPEWEEQVGKERIRKHIDWIMDRLESYSTSRQQVTWQEQQTLIRKELDKWLDARQLLQVVMQGESMKVTCRKVGNDHQVSRVAYSWEQSNRWSGGEKWSKNMTLFLGLLNYIAERKQYIQAKMKRHRTVILDNPFGKASSDHVLSPVFFIAEQLGFQMIALTAHVEGKFLQDYFPIVYSCRLRHTTDVSKQIVETSQQIKIAFFQDHDPETLERIGTRVSQLELF